LGLSLNDSIKKHNFMRGAARFYGFASGTRAALRAAPTDQKESGVENETLQLAQGLGDFSN
jgi:hypothetical protein